MRSLWIRDRSDLVALQRCRTLSVRHIYNDCSAHYDHRCDHRRKHHHNQDHYRCVNDNDQDNHSCNYDVDRCVNDNDQINHSYHNDRCVNHYEQDNHDCFYDSGCECMQ